MKAVKKNTLFEDILRTVSKYFIVIIVAVLILICCSGIRFIKSGESAIILRFGKLVGQTREEQVHDSGLLLAFPYIIDEVITVPTGSIMEMQVTTHNTDGEMTTYDKNGYVITGDNNIALITASVKYTVSDPVNYALSVQNPAALINATVSNSMVNISARSSVDSILTTGKEQFTADVLLMSQEKLDFACAGVKLTSIELTRVAMPEEVRDVYEAVTSANVQASTLVEQARQYRETRLPAAESEANLLISEALAYQSNSIAAANSDLAEFYGVIDEYSTNPEVVKVRLYNVAMSNILKRIGTIRVVDDSDSKIVIN